jgi:hypothetical protein
MDACGTGLQAFRPPPSPATGWAFAGGDGFPSPAGATPSRPRRPERSSLLGEDLRLVLGLANVTLLLRPGHEGDVLVLPLLGLVARADAVARAGDGLWPGLISGASASPPAARC